MRVLPHLSLLVCLLAPVAHAQPAGPVVGDPAAIARLMTELGMPATSATDIQGIAMLEAQVDGILFNVYFYDCDKLCRRMQFVTGFRLAQPMTTEDANSWNRDNPVGKLVLNDAGDPYLEMDIGVAADGIGRKNFEDALDTWRDVLGDFRASLTE